MNKKKNSGDWLTLPGAEWFDLDGHGNLPDSAVENDNDDTQPPLLHGADLVMCPQCESENVNFHGQARAKYIARLRPYTCLDCGFEFNEGDWNAVF